MNRKNISILAIDDDPGDVTILRRNLDYIKGWEIEFSSSADFESAQPILGEKQVDIIFVDYLMGRETGLDVLAKIRSAGFANPVIMLTGKGNENVAVEAMKLGASDYLIKDSVSGNNLERAILNALEKNRLQKKVEEQRLQLEKKVVELEAALDHVKQLQGLLPICMHCKRIRDGKDSWQQLEKYISEHSEAEFSHSLCQECREKYYPEMIKK